MGYSDIPFCWYSPLPSIFECLREQMSIVSIQKCMERGDLGWCCGVDKHLFILSLLSLDAATWVLAPHVTFLFPIGCSLAPVSGLLSQQHLCSDSCSQKEILGTAVFTPQEDVNTHSYEQCLDPAQTSASLRNTWVCIWPCKLGVLVTLEVGSR